MTGVDKLGLVAPNEAVRFTALSGGVSSDIVKVESASRTFVVKRALAKLRVADDWQAPVSRNRHEADWLEVAGAIVPGAVPEVLARDDEAGMFAMPYFDLPVWKQQLRDGIVDVAFAAEVGRALVRIHAKTAGDRAVAERFDTGDIFRAIRLEPYFGTAGARNPSVAPSLDALAASTLATNLALVHGDVSPKNILVGPLGPIFLDAECAWYGDPAFDLAFCLNHLLLKCLWNRAAAPRLLDALGALAAAYLAGVDWEPRKVFERRAAALLPALLLARVDGKSPVEYLDETDRERVRRFALPRIADPPASLADFRL